MSKYTPSLLYPLERVRLREGLAIDGEELPFHGSDLWTAWELSWLDRDGKPEIGVAQIRVPCDSMAVTESKSLKLYLGSFSQTSFASAYDVVRTLESDIAVTVGGPVVVDLVTVSQLVTNGVSSFPGDSLDSLRIKPASWQPEPELLQVVEDGRVAAEALYTNLFRCVCPATGQPDLASVQVTYSGTRIDHEALLNYLLSYREYAGFHEHCIEKIFLDIMQRCRPRDLAVYGRFLRRGGIDINPYRSTTKGVPPASRLARQ